MKSRHSILSALFYLLAFICELNAQTFTAKDLEYNRRESDSLNSIFHDILRSTG